MVVDDPHLRPLAQLSHALVVGKGSAGEVEAGTGILGGAVAARDLHPEAPGECLVLGDDRVHAGGLERSVGVARALGLLPEEVRNRAEQEHRGGAVLGDVPPEVLVAIAAAQDDGGAAQHRSVEHTPLPGDMEERQAGAVVAVAAPHRMVAGHVPCVAVGVRVADHHALRGAGGARGVHDAGEVAVRGLVVGRDASVPAERRVAPPFEHGERQRLEATRDTLGQGFGQLGIDDAALERLKLLRHRFEALEEARVDDDRAREAVVDDAAQEGAPVGEVDGHLGRAAPGETTPQGGEVDAVRHHEEHRIALLDAERDEPARDARRALVHLPVGDGAAAHLDNQRRVSQLRRGMGENAPDGTLLERILVGKRGHHGILGQSCARRPSVAEDSWIPAFAGMTGTGDSNARTPSMFLPRQRGQIPWPWQACTGMTAPAPKDPDRN